MIGHGGQSQIMKSLSGLERAGAEELIRERKVKHHYCILSEDIPKKMS